MSRGAKGTACEIRRHCVSSGAFFSHLCWILSFVFFRTIGSDLHSSRRGYRAQHCRSRAPHVRLLPGVRGGPNPHRHFAGSLWPSPGSELPAFGRRRRLLPIRDVHRLAITPHFASNDRLGVAAALTAGLKSSLSGFRSNALALLNGYMVMLGSLGAVTTTAPAEHLLGGISWRELFEILAVASSAPAVFIYIVVPERAIVLATGSMPGTLSSVFGDRRFWRIAPLSATCVGSAWSMGRAVADRRRGI